MKKNKRLALSLGAIAALTLPATVVMVNEVNANSKIAGKELNWGNKRNNTNLFGSYSAATSSKIVEKNPSLIPSQIGLGQTHWEYIKEIGGVTYIRINHTWKKMENSNAVDIFKSGALAGETVGEIYEIGNKLYFQTLNSGLILTNKDGSSLSKIKINPSIKGEDFAHFKMGKIGNEIYGVFGNTITKLVGDEFQQVNISSNPNFNKFAEKQKNSHNDLYANVRFEGNKMYFDLNSNKPSGGKEIFSWDGKKFDSVSNNQHVTSWIKSNGNIYAFSEEKIWKIVDGKMTLYRSVKDLTKFGQWRCSSILEINGEVYAVILERGIFRLENDKVEKVIDVHPRQGAEATIFQFKNNFYYNSGTQWNDYINLLDFKDVESTNKTTIENIFKKPIAIVNKGNLSTEEVASKITDLKTLERYTGITLPKFHWSQIKYVNVSYNKSAKQIIVTLEITTTSRPAPAIITATLGKPNKELTTAKNNLNSPAASSQNNHKRNILLIILTILTTISLGSLAVYRYKTRN